MTNYVIKDEKKIKPKPYKEICEFCFNKGYILGLEKAKGLKETEIDVLIKIYEAKTKYMDILLEDKDE